MIGENRHLADNATLNTHRKAPSEVSTRELPILANHTLLNHRPPLPLLTNWSWYGRPLSPFLRYCKPSNERQAPPLLTLTLAAPHDHPRLSSRSPSPLPQDNGRQPTVREAALCHPHHGLVCEDRALGGSRRPAHRLRDENGVEEADSRLTSTPTASAPTARSSTTTTPRPSS